MWLTRFAIGRPVIVAMFFIGLAVFGTISYKSMGVALFPNVQFPIVVVSAIYPGASPSEMEKLIVKPIEDEIDGIAHLDKMTAVAQEGRAVIIVQFKLDTDLDLAGIDVQRRVETARVNMPTDLNPPLVTTNAGSTAADPIITEAVSSTALSREKVSDLVKDRIVPELKHVPGVDSADLRGEVLREIHVYPDSNKLLGTTATLADLFTTISRNNSNLPGGRIDQPTVETSVSVHADIVQPQDLLAVPVAVPGGAQSALKLGDVATVEDGHVEQRIVSHYNGNPTVIIDITRQPTADELKTTAAVRAKFKELIAKYPQIQFKEIAANADYTQASVNGVLENLGEGIFLTAIVMLLFLHAWRNALVVMISIPSSLLATFVVMHWLNFTVDLISLMGLGLTIGILVDDSIVVLENITRHRDMGEDAFGAALTGRTEIGLAAVTITLVDVVVFLPIAFLSGIVGKYMKEFGIVIVVATLFSLFVSFTLTPLLAARWAVKERSKAPPRSLAWFQRGFDRLLQWYRHTALPFALAHPKFIAFTCFVLVANSLMLPAGALRTQIALLDLILAVAVAVDLVLGTTLLRRVQPAPRYQRLQLAGRPAGARIARRLGRVFEVAVIGRFKSLQNGVANARLHPRMTLLVIALLLAVAGLERLLPNVGSEFIPNSETGVVRGTITYPVGTPLTVTQAGINRLENELIKIPHVDSVTTSAGLKPSGFGSTIAGNVGRFTLTMDKNYRRETTKALDQVRTLNWTLPGADFQAFKEGGGGGGGGPIYYTLSGPDATLNAGAEKLAQFIRAQKGTINVQTGAENEAPRLNIHIDPARAAVLGVSPGDAATAARIAVGGAVATKVRTPSGLVDVRLELPKDQRSSIADVKNIKVRSTSGGLYDLNDIAAFDLTRAPTKIERLNRERVVRVTGDLDTNLHVSLGDVLAPVQKALDTPGFLPPGTRAIAQGDSELFNQTFQSMGLALVTSFTLVYMLMVILYGSFVEPFVIMFSVPVAMVGAFAGLALRGQTLNLFSMIAIIMLFGLVAKNGILLVDYANTMRKRGQNVAEAMLTAAHTRFRPILMTTCAMVFGMFPLATGIVEGAEERASMGTVLIGGLLSSLVLTLFLVPIMYNAIMGAEERRHARREAERAQDAEQVRRFGGEPVGVSGG